jgi:acetaldehyde dehydrogenase/alcohol dehydrogenase
MNSFKPDVIIALGGGSPMDGAKIMWMMYEHPDADFEGMAMRFMDIRKRVYDFPKLGEKATMVAIPTTSGTGSEVTPFAVITDEKTGYKYPLADYELTPDMAIVDPELVMSMPPRLTAFSGIDAITHALETYASVLATDFTNGSALEATKNLFEYLPRSYKSSLGKGNVDVEAREKVHFASTMAGMAFSNAFLGICHSLAHKLGAEYHLPHGLANALLINQVIRFNQNNDPNKLTAFAQYKYPVAEERYAEIAQHLGLAGTSNAEKVDALIAKITELKKQLDIPLSIKEALKDSGVSQKDFEAKLDELSERAFDDQCTGANPVYPYIAEIKDIYRKAYKGEA